MVARKAKVEFGGKWRSLRHRLLWRIKANLSETPMVYPCGGGYSWRLGRYVRAGSEPLVESPTPILATSVPPGWHAACGLVVSFGFPLLGACAVSGFLLDQAAFYITALILIVIMLPFAFGLELLARSVVKLRRGSLRGWNTEIDLVSVRLELLTEQELRLSLERLGLTDVGVFLARKATWLISFVLVIVAAMVAIIT